jgi:hypothetical protein
MESMWCTSLRWSKNRVLLPWIMSLRSPCVRWMSRWAAAALTASYTEGTGQSVADALSADYHRSEPDLVVWPPNVRLIVYWHLSITSGGGHEASEKM